MNKIVIAAVIKNSIGQVLAVRLNKEKPEGVWVMPGGKLEDGETARECIIREAKEELGIEINPLKIVAVGEVEYEAGEYWTFIYYQSVILSGIPIPMEIDKTLEVKFLDKANLYMAEKIIWFG